MAKGIKSFADKAKAKNVVSNRQVRVIRSRKVPKTGTVKYFDRMETVPGDANLDDYLAKMVSTEK